MHGQEMGARDDSGGQFRNLLLWVGITLPATAWMIQLFALYMLEDFISCTPGSQTPGVILGLGVRPLALLITGVLALSTAAAGLVSLRMWREIGGPAGEGGAGRASWMALAGMMSSILFLLIILIKVAPPLMIGVCQAPL